MVERVTSTQKEAVRKFIAEHGDDIQEEIAPYDGLHHELKLKVDLIPRVKPEDLKDWMAYIEVLRDAIRHLETRLISNLTTYIIAPREGIIHIGQSAEQTASEVLSGFPDLQQTLQRGEVVVCAGYRFNLTVLGVSVATIEPVYAMMTFSARFADPFAERLGEITRTLEENGHIPMAYAEETKLRVL